MPLPAPQQFDIAPMLSTFNQGRAAKVALEDRQRQMEQQAQDAIFRAADLADTPEKWDRFISTIGAQFPDADLSAFSDFSSRDAAIAQSMDPYQRAQLDLARRDQEMQERALAAQQAAANRASAGLVQDTVNGVLGQRNPVTNEFTPFPQWMQVGTTAPVDVEGENALRDDFERLTANQRTIDNSYQTIQTVAANPSPAGDISLVFAYMRMLDPTSTVREGEFATAQQTTTLPGQIVNAYNRLIETGELLNQEQRNDFVAQAGALRNAAAGQYTQLADYFTANAEAYGMDPTRIVRPFGSPAPEVAAPAGFVTPQAAPAAAPALAPYGATPAPASVAPVSPGGSGAAAAPAPTPTAATPDRSTLTRENIVTTMRAWEAAGNTQSQALQALATQYGMTVAQVRSLLTGAQ